MKDGRLLQVGTPDEIYYRPTHRFVAEFIGATNLLPVSVASNGDAFSYAFDALTGTSSFAQSSTVSDSAHLMVRPEFMQIAGIDAVLDNRVEITVDGIFNHGSTTQIVGRMTAADHVITLEVQGHLDPAVKIGSMLSVGWHDKDTHLIAMDDAGDKTG